MGFITDLRTIKRGINGEMDRDLGYITEPAALDHAGGSAEALPDLKRAVTRRSQREADSERWLHAADLYDSLNRDADRAHALGGQQPRRRIGRQR